MAKIQQYTDSSISKTVNCPVDTTNEEMDRLYRLAYGLGCKGLTTYRDKCRETQVLNSVEETATPQKQLDWGDVMSKPKDTIYRLVKFTTGCGRIKLMIGTATSMGNRVIDIYTIINSAGGCQLNIQGEAITISKYLRMGGNINQLLENSMEAGNCPSYQFKRGQGCKELYGKSCFNGVVRAIADFQNGTLPEYVEVEGPPYEGPNFSFNKSTIIEAESVINKKDATLLNNDNTCPGCGNEMTKETGCWQYKHCGFSKCE
jgi:ribonucleoside-diphosphate reductase alpha chain